MILIPENKKPWWTELGAHVGILYLASVLLWAALMLLVLR